MLEECLLENVLRQVLLEFVLCGVFFHHTSPSILQSVYKILCKFYTSPREVKVYLDEVFEVYTSPSKLYGFLVLEYLAKYVLSKHEVYLKRSI